MIVITIPKILQEKLGQQGADALAQTLNKMEESHRDHILEVAEGRFEKRLTEAKEELRGEISQVRSELKEEISKVRIEIANTRSDLIKWMFLFWLGQVGLFMTFLRVK